MNYDDAPTQTPQDHFITPPVIPHQSGFDDGQSYGRESSGSELNILDNTVEEFEDDQKTPGLTLAGPAHSTEVRRKTHSTDKAILEATLINLRSKLAEIEKDDWLYEGPRHSYR